MHVLSAWDAPPVQYYQALAALLPVLLVVCLYQAKIVDTAGLDELEEQVHRLRDLTEGLNETDDDRRREKAELLRSFDDDMKWLNKSRATAALLSLSCLITCAGGLVATLLALHQPGRLVTLLATMSVGGLMAFGAAAELSRARVPAWMRAILLAGPFVITLGFAAVVVVILVART